MLLVHTTEHAVFVGLIAEHREVLIQMQQELNGNTEALQGLALIHGAMAHLNYLESYWGTEALWKSWSDFGRCVAAVRLGCTIEGVLPTTNHLESFNGVFKNKHVKRWQHYGRALRVDVFTSITITKVLPAIFQQRELEQQQNILWERQLLQLPGGAALLAQKKGAKAGQLLPPVAYITSDESRDAGTALLLQNKQISTPSFEETTLTFAFACYSSLTTPYDKEPITYRIELSVHHTGLCSCQDFLNRGGVCKHMRAALLVLDSLRHTMNVPAVSLPSSEDEARKLGAELLVSAGAIPLALRSLQADVAEPPRYIQCAANAVQDAMQDGIPEEGEDVEAEGKEGKEGKESDEDTEDGLLGEDPSSNGESVATEASGSPFDFTTLMTSSRAAVHEQRTSRALHELETVAPKLGLLAEYLATGKIRNADDAQRIRSLKASVDKLSSRLGQLLLDPSSPGDVHIDNGPSGSQGPRNLAATVSLRPSTPPEPYYHSKCWRTDIIDASPEKKQKRKQSYSVY
ncbi:uncharacterized protein PHACADRAFT_203530 [Phanerochaete carnosa HHB-10118-sp]|uniref:SWIM-type domain-containing protein n=1 Tax=Phanerochaete carnosa (strain HHB-10118-sp) TaxID=650164 RepID=K5WLL8_PHACS|nr:uncharacterized protein PHACADRAFT_203530 [Phanerochaete carnosa HHB-10118-sp]EKM60295.1 hypothetical protein PHACADRAFT_203530 [Phanerochaete carnosa HHB-10118-sp]